MLLHQIKNNKPFIVLLVCFFCTACTTTKITSSWHSKELTNTNFKKILILSLSHDTNKAIQQKMENHLVEGLQQLNYAATSAYQEYGPKAFENMDENIALQQIKNSGIDAIITIVLLDKTKERKYIPGNIHFTPYTVYYNKFWGYQSTIYHRIYEPGYYVTNEKYFWETNLYDMRNNSQALIYSVQSQSFDPTNSETLAHQYGKLIIADMVKKNMLQQLPPNQ